MATDISPTRCAPVTQSNEAGCGKTSPPDPGADTAWGSSTKKGQGKPDSPATSLLNSQEYLVVHGGR
jgi:hypothetical protein